MKPTQRIAVYGEFGGGNIGNDASLGSLLSRLQGWGHDPSGMLCLCRGPESVAESYGMQADRIGGRNPSRRLGRFSGTISWLEKVRDLFRMAALMGGVDVVLVPGTGIVEEGVRAWSMPYDLYCLGLACRLRSTKLVVLCVGASVPRSRLTQLFFRGFLRAADYRSFRDEHSKRAAVNMGVPAHADPVYTDLVLGDAPVQSDPPPSAVVGLGVITHAGGQSRDARARSEHASYVAALVSLVGRLVADGKRVRLLIGDNGDLHVVDEVLDGLPRDAMPGSVSTSPVGSFADVISAVAQCEVLVASRYHNLIAGALAVRPTVALGYGPKHLELQRFLGLAEFTHDIAKIDVDLLLKQIEELTKDASRWRLEVTAALGRARTLLELQDADMRSLLDVPADVR